MIINVLNRGGRVLSGDSHLSIFVDGMSARFGSHAATVARRQAALAQLEYSAIHMRWTDIAKLIDACQPED